MLATKSFFIPNDDPFSATGGDSHTQVGSYWIHVFTTVGSSSFVALKALTVDVLMVGGGGAGGRSESGGGGGAGGLVYYSQKSLSAGTYAVAVGVGGTGVSSSNTNGGHGGDTTFAGLTTAYKGSGGQEGSGGGVSGNYGSGGGGGYNGDPVAVPGVNLSTSYQGTEGGMGRWASGQNSAGGGGGGYMAYNSSDSSSAGSASTYVPTGAKKNSHYDTGSKFYPGKGGDGVTEGSATTIWNFTASATTTLPANFQSASTNSSYAGGGAGASNVSALANWIPAVGGNGGGGTGGYSGVHGVAGTNGTGGGGGGVMNSGTSPAGGSGIIIVRYAV